jgi:hypothetical protein
VGGAVFKTVERQSLSLVGSIPIRLRHLRFYCFRPLPAAASEGLNDLRVPFACHNFPRGSARKGGGPAITLRTSLGIRAAISVVPHGESEPWSGSLVGRFTSEAERGIMVEHKDVAMTLLGASAGIAGLTLVFVGLVVAGVQGFAPGTDPAVVAPYKRPAITAVSAFVVSMACVALATAWMIDSHHPGSLYTAVVASFFVQLGLLLAATVHVLVKFVWG